MKSFRLLLRCATVGALILLLLIPLTLVRGVIQERQSYRDMAVRRVSESKAGAQTFTGPVRVVPWTQIEDTTAFDGDGKRHVERRTVAGYELQAPRQLKIDGRLVPSERRIGLFRVPVYQWTGRIEADFAAFDYSIKAERTYGTPYLAIGVSDVRGLAGMPTLRIDGATQALQAGTKEFAGVSQGIHAPLPVGDTQAGHLPALDNLTLQMMLDGTQALSIAPIGDDNKITLHSAWPHPSFGGSFLPYESNIDAQGFKASWAVSSLASDAQRKLLAPGTGVPETLQVSLVDPVDVYTQADRASKYGILFVLLTFVGFALFELIKRLPIHPLQYLLVGLALAIFFLLLIGLSEHIAFWKAYLVSSTACIGLQLVYLSGVLRSWWRASGFATLLTALYGVLYTLLASEDNALLMGALLLFGILAVIMWITRKVDWYDLSASLR
ncbi:MAG: cell envelope integrity protein CreD [Pseudoxanthomonas sp.]